MEIATRTQSFVVVVALVSGVVEPAWAAATPATVGSSIDDEKQARSLYERAEKSFDLGRFAEALADYQSAYEAKPLPGFLFNIAQCYRNMSNFERARFFFRRYLALDPRAPNRRRVDELIAEMSKQLDAHAAEAAAPPPAAVEPKPVEAPPLPVAAAPVEPAVTPTAAPLVAAQAPPPARRPVWKRWWFWTGVGAVVVGGVVAGLLLSRPETRTPGSL